MYLCNNYNTNPLYTTGAQNTSPSDPYCAGVGNHEANQQNSGFMSNTNSMYPSSVAPYNESTQAHAQNTPSNNHYQVTQRRSEKNKIKGVLKKKKKKYIFFLILFILHRIVKEEGQTCRTD